MWDYDLPAAPNLVDITVDGKPIKAVAQVTKQAFIYVFDRVTGSRCGRSRSGRCRPRPSPASGVADPAVSDQARAVRHPGATRRRSDRLHAGASRRRSISQPTMIAAALFTPPSLRGTVQVPGNVGGASWAGRRSIPKPICSMCEPRACRRSSYRQARTVGKGVRLYRPAPICVGTARLAAPQAAIRQHGRDRHEYRRASLADSGRPQMAMQSIGAEASGSNWVAQRSCALVTKTVMIVVQMGFSARCASFRASICPSGI